jgi:hypothetical protein
VPSEDWTTLDGLTPRAGANLLEIKVAERQLGRRLPEDYRRFLEISNGIEGFLGADGYIILWSTAELAEYNRGYLVEDFAPGVVLLGTSGGGTAYGFMEGKSGPAYVQLPLVRMSPDALEEMGGSLEELVRRLQAGSRAWLDWPTSRGQDRVSPVRAAAAAGLRYLPFNPLGEPGRSDVGRCSVAPVAERQYRWADEGAP